MGVYQLLRGTPCFWQKCATAQYSDAGRGPIAKRFEQIHALNDIVFYSLGHCGMLVGLIHQSEIVVDGALLDIHMLESAANDHRQFEGICRVVADAVWHCGRQQVGMTILMLQALAIQRSPACGTPKQKAFSLQIASGPGQVANALEAEHGVIDVERQQRVLVSGIRSGRGDPSSESARFVNALFQNLARLRFFVSRKLVRIFGFVELAL